MKKNFKRNISILFATVVGLSVLSGTAASYAAGFTTVTISSKKEVDKFTEKFVDKKGNLKTKELSEFITAQTGFGDCKVVGVKREKGTDIYIVEFERNDFRYDFTTDGKSGMITDINYIKPINPDQPNKPNKPQTDDKYEEIFDRDDILGDNDDDKFDKDDDDDDDRFDKDDDDDDRFDKDDDDDDDRFDKDDDDDDRFDKDDDDDDRFDKDDDDDDRFDKDDDDDDRDDD